MEPPSSLPRGGISDPQLRVTIQSEEPWALEHGEIVRAIEASLRSESIMSASVDVLLCKDETIRDLNLRFRGVDGATDVLTFPNGNGADGDIAIAVPYAQRQARLRGATDQEEVQFLAIHAALHLAGYDDEDPEERAEMVAKMNAIAESLGLPRDDAWWSRAHEEVPA